MKVTWKDIPDYSNYQASRSGQIRRIGSDKPLKPIKAGEGYLKVILNGKQLYIHRLVASTFIGDIPKGFQINHLDKNRLRNELQNLEICTPSENMSHAYAPIWYNSQTRLPNF